MDQKPMKDQMNKNELLFGRLRTSKTLLFRAKSVPPGLPGLGSNARYESEKYRLMDVLTVVA
jgi:hypothetical protein